MLRLVWKNKKALPRLFFNFLKNKAKLDYKYFSSGRALMPTTITFCPTMRCNLHCAMCLIPNKSDFLQAQELSQTRIFELIDEVANFKPHFYLTGGEPFLRQDIFEIIARAKNRGLVCTLTTNGTLVSQSLAAKIAESPLDSLTFSLDGGREDHDCYRGAGNWQKTINGLESLIRAKGQKNFPEIRISAVINDLNYLHLDQILDIARQYKIKNFNFNHMEFKSEAWAKQAEKQLQAIFPDEPCLVRGYITDEINFDLEKFAVHLREIKEKYQEINISFTPPVPLSKIVDYYTLNHLPPQAFCAKKWEVLTILPNGDLTPCLGLIMGNLKNSSFKEIWNNKKYKDFRKKLKQCKKFQGCLRCCGLTPNY